MIYTKEILEEIARCKDVWLRIAEGTFESRINEDFKVGSIRIQWDGRKQQGRLHDPFKIIEQVRPTTDHGWTGWIPKYGKLQPAVKVAKKLIFENEGQNRSWLIVEVRNSCSCTNPLAVQAYEIAKKELGL